MKSYLDQSSHYSYSFPEDEMTAGGEHLHPRTTTSQKTGLADVFSQDTIEQALSAETEQADGKRTSDVGFLNWFLSFFTSFKSAFGGKSETDVAGSLEPTANKLNAAIDPDHLQKVIHHLNAVNERMKEFDEECNLDRQFMEIHIALAELKEELAKTVTGDIHKTYKVNAEKKRESRKKLDDLVEAGRKRAWTNTIQSGLGFGALLLSAASLLGISRFNVVANPIYVVSQLLATATNQYYKIKHNTLNSTHIVDQAEIQRSHKKIEGLLGELKAMTDSVYRTQKLTGSLLKNHHTAVTSILQQ